MRRSLLVVLVAGASVALLAFAAVPAAGTSPWLRPVDGRVVRAFHAPLTRFGAGHLGVDLAAAPGTVVRAAGAGTVVFAGSVADARHVVVRHPGARRTSYSFLASIRVHTGQAVRRGTVLGTTGGTGEHHDGGVLHFALRVGATFVDPISLFDPAGLPVRVHLAPLAGAGPLPAPGPGPEPRRAPWPQPSRPDLGRLSWSRPSLARPGCRQRSRCVTGRSRCGAEGRPSPSERLG
jgi:murein DD-endopeptidase MepM/ murein hydrolase activator NlpD